MSRHTSDEHDSTRTHHIPRAMSPETRAARDARDAPAAVVQVGLAAGIVAAVVVASFPAVAATGVAAVVVGMAVTTVGRAVHRAAERETTVRVPGAGVEVTVARSSRD
ncbi:hypothetical protein [Halogeometricum limi]|uniref:Uncharacterized protein n=1 Tax=Halogeometricum limi TaxID=555875 RepID=A0A1I6GKD2_9EURY|nr:hypothetical protein [Halogeometricum limi]SFR42517.1 hypothetical protein SAMN04488124_1161 [Halogeometricum limi]